MSGKTIRVGLLWHSMNSDNLGVGALTIGHMQLISDVCMRIGVKPVFVVLCWKDDRPNYFAREDIEIVRLRMKDFLSFGDGLLGAVQRCDLVLDIGAGDSFSDIYGASRILKMLLAQNIVLFSGKKLILSPQTLGPFASKTIEILAKNVISRSYAVCTRDRLSSEYARNIGVSRNIIEATDVAFRLPFQPPEAVSSRTKVGLNISGLLMHGGYTGSNMFNLKVDYNRCIRKIVEYFVNEQDCELHLIGHVLSSTETVGNSLSPKMKIEDDRQVSLALAEEYPDIVVAPKFRSPIEAKTYIASMDFMAGARMHACIAALSAGVPVVPMAYSRKFIGLFDSLGYHYVVDCTELPTEAVFEKVLGAYRDRSQLKSDAELARNAGFKKLKPYEDLVETCIRETCQ